MRSGLKKTCNLPSSRPRGAATCTQHSFKRNTSRTVVPAKSTGAAQTRSAFLMTMQRGAVSARRDVGRHQHGYGPARSATDR